MHYQLNWLMRHSDIKRSIPKISAIPATGTAGTTDKVAASVIKPAPVTPAAPLELTIATKSNATCSPIDKSTLHACAINKSRHSHIDVSSIKG